MVVRAPFGYMIRTMRGTHWHRSFFGVALFGRRLVDVGVATSDVHLHRCGEAFGWVSALVDRTTLC